MWVVRVRLVECSKYGFLVFDYLSCSNAIARKKLTSNITMRAFWHQVNKGLSKREIYIVRTNLGSEVWANMFRQKK